MARRAAGCAALVVLVAGCGGGTTASRSASPSPVTSATATSTHVAPVRRRRPRPSGAPVGATQRVHAGSSTLAVNVNRVIDPVPDGGTPVAAGVRPVGVMVVIRNLGGGTYDSTASGDWSLITSLGPGSPLFIRHGVCQTPLVDFESLIGAGETRSGCVAFSVARRARIAAVRFSPRSRAGGAVTWVIRPGSGG